MCARKTLRTAGKTDSQEGKQDAGNHGERWVPRREVGTTMKRAENRQEGTGEAAGVCWAARDAVSELRTSELRLET